MMDFDLADNVAGYGLELVPETNPLFSEEEMPAGSGNPNYSFPEMNALQEHNAIDGMQLNSNSDRVMETDESGIFVPDSLVAASEAASFARAEHQSEMEHQDMGGTDCHGHMEHSGHDMDDPRMEEHMALLELMPHEEATHIARSSGSWFDANTWQHGRIPGDGAKVLIPACHQVTYDRESHARLDIVRIDGTLSFKSDRNTLLIADTIISDSHSTLEIGTEENPIQADKTARILIHNDRGAIDPQWDPELLSRGVITHGKVRIHGADKSDFLSLQDEARAGDEELVLSQAPIGWRVGDRLVLGGTSYNPNGDDEDNSRFQDEVLTITAIDGNRIRFTNNDIASGNNTVLRFDHTQPEGFEEYDLKIYVANTTRNVVFATADAENVPTQQRGHVMFMHNPDVVVQHAGFYDLGRSDKDILVDDPGTNVDGSPGGGTNPRGRYSLHLHRTGAEDIDSTPSLVRGVAVEGSPGWGIVHHDSHAHLYDNVVFDVVGSAIVAEAGNEIGLWQNNLTIKTTGDSRPQPDFDGSERVPVFDFGFNGEGYWVQGAAQVKILDNIAISAATGINIFSGVDHNDNRDADTFPVKNADPDIQDVLANADDGRDPDNVDVTNIPLRKFSGFESYNTDVGIIFWNHMRNDDGQLGFIGPGTIEAHKERALVEDFKLWNIFGEGVFLQYSTQIDFKNGLIVGNPEDPVPVKLGINGSGRGHGVGSNGPAQDLSFSGLHIEGFERGMRLPREGKGGASSSGTQGIPFLGSRLENSTFANNTYNLSKKERNFGDPDVFPDYFEIVNTTFEIADATDADAGSGSHAHQVSDLHNEAPIALFNANNIGGENVVLFDASDSYDPDPPASLELAGNAIASYAWDFDNDGEIDDFGRRVNYAFPEPGEYEVGLTVWDAYGQTTQSVQTISVEPTVYPNLFVNGDFSEKESLGNGSIKSIHYNDAWRGSRVEIRDGVLEFTEKDKFNLGRIGVLQTWLDNGVRRGLQTLQLDLENTEGTDDQNQIFVEVWGIKGEFSASVGQRRQPEAVGAIPMEATPLLQETLELGNFNWTTFEWDVNFGDGYQYLLFRINAKNFDPAVGDSIAADNFFLGSLNLAPIANDDFASTLSAQSVDIDVLANDTDPHGDSLNILEFSQPNRGSVSVEGELLSYTPDPGFVGEDSFSYTIDDGNGTQATATVAIQVSAPESLDLVAQLSFEEGQGTVAADSSPGGSDNRGTLQGDATWDNGVVGGGIAFDGNGDLVAIADAPDLNLDSHQQRTVSLWFQASDTRGTQVIYEEGGTIRGLNIYLEGNRLYAGGWNRSESGWDGTWLSADGIVAGQWYHVALVLDGTEEVASDALVAYLDGEEFGRGDGSMLWGHSDDIGLGNVNGYTRLSSGTVTGSVWGWHGYLDELQIYNHALDASQILALFNRLETASSNSSLDLIAELSFNEDRGTLAADSSPGGSDNRGTLQGDATWDDGVVGGGIAFDGDGDLVAIADAPDLNLDSHQQRTVSLWFQASDTRGTQVIYEEGGTIRGLNIYLEGNRLYAGGWNRSESGWDGTWLSADGIVAGQWYHLALVLDGTEEVASDALVAYLDGEEFGRGDGSMLWGRSDDVGLGNVNGYTRLHKGVAQGHDFVGFNGLIDEVKIYNGAVKD